MTIDPTEASALKAAMTSVVDDIESHAKSELDRLSGIVDSFRGGFQGQVDLMNSMAKKGFAGIKAEAEGVIKRVEAEGEKLLGIKDGDEAQPATPAPAADTSQQEAKPASQDPAPAAAANPTPATPAS